MENNQQTQRFGVGSAEDILTVVQTAIDKKEQERDVHWSVKVFGGALLSVVAVVVIGAFQSAFQGINDCQKSIQQQTSAVVPKDEFNTRFKTMWDSVKEATRDNEVQKTEIASLKERVKLLEQEVRDLRSDLQKLRDRIPTPAPAPVQPQRSPSPSPPSH